MWMPVRANPGAKRTPTIYSVASTHPANRPVSIPSSQVRRQSGGYESDQSSDTALEDEYSISPRARRTAVRTMWQVQRQQPDSTASPVKQRMGSNYNAATSMDSNLPKMMYHQQHIEDPSMDDDATSRSSTLDGDEDDTIYPAKASKSLSALRKNPLDTEPASPVPAVHVPGPLESQLAALMSKLIYLERANPSISVTPDEYHTMQLRLNALEEEKKHWWKRHEAIWALRDEDVENNIKIRAMLASCRRELDATKTLRDEDLKNVQLVRGKLAEKTRELERLQSQTGRASPSRGRPGSFFERRDTSDLFTAAKVAALEQRALELEKRNSDLVLQLKATRSGTDIDEVNRLTAHQAWKDTVATLESKLKAKDTEMAQLRSSSGRTGTTLDWDKVEGLLEEHASYREAVGGKLQALRSEKETLQRDLHRKENDCQALELKVQNLQRRASML